MWRVEIRWPRWPTLRTTATDLSVRELLIQILRDDPTNGGVLSHAGSTNIPKSHLNILQTFK
jgi:hypothetical protein